MTGPSCDALVYLVEAWGLAFGRLAKPGVSVASSVAAGEVELGFQQLSELVRRPGTLMLGVLPADCAINSACVVEVLAFCAAAGAAKIITAHAFLQPERVCEGLFDVPGH